MPLGRRDMVAMALLVAALAIATIAWGERIGVNGGEGWDGRAYAAWARDFPGEVLGHGVNAYQSQRVVPSAIVYYATAALGLPHTRAGVIFGFQLLDALCLVATALVLYRIARALAWSRAAAWAAFAAVFESFAVARNALYYPTLTDPTALALGAALVCAFVERRPVAIAAVAVVAAGTWPALLPLALAALVLPRPPEPLPGALPEVTGGWVRLAALAVAAAAALTVVLGLRSGLRHPYHPGLLAAARHELFVVTIPTCAAIVAAGAHAVARQPRTWALVAYVRGLGRWRTALAIAAGAAIVVASALWVRRVGTQGSGITVDEFKAMWAESALRAPLWGAVHHVVYFGPIALVAIGAWRHVAAVIARWGPAAVVMAAMLVILSIATESRVMSHLFVFAAVCAIEATAERWTPRRAVVFAALAAVWSKLWWKIGYDVPHDARGWPDQRFTMHHGPWASDLTFVLHLAAAVITAAVLAYMLRPPGQRRVSASPNRQITASSPGRCA
ncbi:MAG TPA: hypothetical protein VFT22_16135 [Kofleriaceae bacterium]|nr:hypothetical protein [Kofleriaceae bacterium]